MRDATITGARESTVQAGQLTAEAARARIAEAGLLDLERALDACVVTLRERFGAVHASIVLREADHRRAIEAVSSDLPRESWPRDWRFDAAPDAPCDDALSGIGPRSHVRIAIGEGHEVPAGCLRLAAPADASFTVEDVQELREIAALVANLVRRADLLAGAERQRQVLETTARILSSLSATAGRERACDTIARHLREFYRADHVSLCAIDAPSQQHHLLGVSSALVRRGDLPALHDAPSSAGRGQFPEHEMAPDVHAPLLRVSGARSFVHGAFRLPDGRDGQVTVASRDAHAFLACDTRHLAELCRAVDVALGRVDQLASMAATASTLEARANVLGLIDAGASLERVAEVYVAELSGAFGATHAMFTRIANGGAAVIAYQSRHLAREEVDLSQLDPETLRHLAPLLRGTVEVIDDLGARTRGTLEERYFAAGVRTLVRHAVRRQDGTLAGIITIGSDRVAAWDAAAIARLGELSAAAGVAIERAERAAAGRDRAANVHALTRLLSALHAGADPHELAQSFAREVRLLLGVDLVAIVGFDADTGEGAPVAEEPPGRDRSWFGVQWPSAAVAARLPASARFDVGGDDASGWLGQFLVRRGLASGVAIRLEAEREAIGLIVVGAQPAGSCGPEQEQLLIEIATPLAMLLERARLLASLRQQADRTHAILDLLAALGPRDTIDDVARPVAAALRTMFGADACAIALARRRELRVAGADGFAAAALDGAVFARGELDAAQWPLRAGVRVVASLDRVRNPLTPLALALRCQGMHSAVEVLFSAAPGVEVLVTLGSSQPRRFVDAQGRQLQQVLRPFGVTVAYHEGRHEVARRARRLEQTNRLLGQLTAGGHPREIAAAILPAARELFDAARAAVLWTDTATGHYDVLALDTPDGDMRLGPLPLPGSVPGMAELAAERAPRRVADVRQEAMPGPLRRSLEAAGLHSALRAPLLVRDEPRGAIVLWGAGADRFTDEDAELLGALSGPLAIALDTALAAEALAESELKYRSLVAQAEEMILLVDVDTLAVLEANPFALRTLGYEPDELAHVSLSDLVDDTVESIQERIGRIVASGQLHIGDRRYVRRDGSPIHVDVVASLVAYGGRNAILLLARDVSEQLALQRQLHQSQKMESLGTMAGNVAHDFNNLLTAVLGFAGILKLSPHLSDEDRETVTLMEGAGRRASDLSRRLLSFARGGLVSFGAVDLRAVVTDTLGVAHPMLKGRISVTTDLPPTPVLVEGDEGQLQQALFNIILNARDALADGGHLHVALAIDGDAAVLEVRDDGRGMDDETRLRIFEPFFTTKPPGTGTGLGMSITYGIVQGHHGTLDVDSAPNAGTTFRLRLPRMSAQHNPSPFPKNDQN